MLGEFAWRSLSRARTPAGFGANGSLLRGLRSISGAYGRAANSSIDAIPSGEP
jgi:hypothetical protein